MLDAYAIKKIAPRILIAVILINLSLYVVVAAAEATRVIANGVGGIIIAPLAKDNDFTVGSNTSITTGPPAQALAIGAFFLAKATRANVREARQAGQNLSYGKAFTNIFNFRREKVSGRDDPATITTQRNNGVVIQALLLFVVLPIGLLTLAIFVTLIIRQGLLVFLAVIAPVACALYILPATEKYFRKWWEVFIKTLLVYPIIVVIFAISSFLATLIFQNNEGSLPGIIAGIIAMFAPMAMIPFAFKLAGGAIAAIYGTLSSGGTRLRQALLGDEQNPDSLRRRTKQRFAEEFARRQAAVVDRGRSLGASRWQRTRGALSRSLFPGIDERSARYQAIARKREEEMSETGRDDLRYAGAGWTIEAGQAAPAGAQDNNGNDISGTIFNYRRYFDGKGNQISASLYNEGKRRHGYSPFTAAQNLEYVVRKIQTDRDHAMYRESLSRMAIAGNWNGQEVFFAHAAAVFGHKDKFIDEWYSRPEVLKDNRNRTTGLQWLDVTENPGAMGGMLTELHKVRQGFTLSTLRDTSVRGMYENQQRINQAIQNRTASDADLRQLAQTNEILDSMTYMGTITRDESGEVSVSGGTPATNAIVKAMFNSRRYKSRPAKESDASGRPMDSANKRDIYDDDAFKAQIEAGSDRETAIRSATVGTTEVTGDTARSDLPRQVGT